MAHAHHHEGHHHHSHALTATQAGSRAFVIGIVLNLVYVVAETVAGLRTHSLALLSDAGHNLSDVASLGLSLIAFRLTRLKPTQEFTYGYKKTTILAALINAVILLIAIGMLSFESISRIGNAQPLKGGIVAWVAGLGIVVNGLSALLFFRNRDELNARSAYLHLLVDALVSAGVVVAGIVMLYTGWYWLDAVVSLAVLLVILYGTWQLLVDSLRLSLDAVPRNVDAALIEKAIAETAGVQSVSHIHIWAMSTTENALTAHVVLSGALEDQHSIIQNIRHELMHHNVQHATIEVDKRKEPGMQAGI